MTLNPFGNKTVALELCLSSSSCLPHILNLVIKYCRKNQASKISIIPSQSILCFLFLVS